MEPVNMRSINKTKFMNSKMSDETLPNLFISLDRVQSEKVTIAPQFNHRHQKRLSEWYSHKKKEGGGGRRGGKED